LGKISLITGITGQDGAYLAKFLLEQGHNVIGVVRPKQENRPIFGLTYLSIASKLRIVSCDLCSIEKVQKLLKDVNPDEIYNLASQSSVQQSFKYPNETLEFNFISVLTLLESIRLVAPNIRFYQASSSEMFGVIDKLPIMEDMAFHPLSPYAVSKASAHWMAKNYRESYGLFIACGILFNHESYLRSHDFFIKKIICEALEIQTGKRQYIYIGNLEVRRDFGFAPRYVEAMYLMLQQNKASDFLICSGKSILLHEIVEYICNKIGVDKSCLKKDSKLYRPLDIPDMYGDNTKAAQELGWSYEMNFFNVLDQLIEEEKENFKDQGKL
jgi:GDPmannose 4,6-dehydratase